MKSVERLRKCGLDSLALYAATCLNLLVLKLLLTCTLFPLQGTAWLDSTPIFTVPTYLFVVQSRFLSPTKLNLFTNVKNQLEKGGTDLRGMCSGLSKKKSAVANVFFIS